MNSFFHLSYFRKKASRFRGLGFTMIELLVAMTIFSLLIVLLMGLVDNATKLWKFSENRMESFREARAALTLISKDLRAAFASTNLTYFSTNAPTAFGASPTDGSIFFLASLPASSQDDLISRGEICAVGYYLKYGKSELGKTDMYSLYRYFRESNETFTNARAESALFQSSPENVEIIARNIPSFQVSCYEVDAAGQVTSWVQSASSPMPSFIDIEITAFNKDTVRRFSGSSDWKDTNSRVYRENSRVFSTRIPLRQPE